MKTGLVLVGWLGIVLLAIGEEESGSQRLENAQQGIAGASWPQKPGSRMSPLSGKMKDVAEISPRFYGQDKEFHGKEAGGWQKEARWGSRGDWETPAGRGWEEARWNQSRDWSNAGRPYEKLQSSGELAAENTTTYRELTRASAPDWSSRSASLGTQREGSLRRYEGRLIRVREQVRPAEPSRRELGPGRQENFAPEEVEKLLAQPVGQKVGAKAQSSMAAPPAAGGN